MCTLHLLKYSRSVGPVSRTGGGEHPTWRKMFRLKMIISGLKTFLPRMSHMLSEPSRGHSGGHARCSGWHSDILKLCYFRQKMLPKSCCSDVPGWCCVSVWWRGIPEHLDSKSTVHFEWGGELQRVPPAKTLVDGLPPASSKFVWARLI